MEKNYHEVATPVEAYITFETEEAYLRAMKLNRKQTFHRIEYQLMFYGFPLYFEPAEEPSSIIWENQFIPRSERVWKLLTISFVMTCIIIISFLFLYYT